VVTAAGCALAVGCATEDGSELQALASATVTGSVTGSGGAPLDSVAVDITVPDQLNSLFDLDGEPGRTDANGRFSIAVEVLTAADPGALPDTLAIYITATATPPRYLPPNGRTSARDSVLVPVAFAPAGDPPPVTETRLTLPVSPPADAVSP
jgi:hypothetical protein